MRIVSLLPSATEILFDLGLGDQVVGVTFECDFPAQAKSKRVVSTSALPENLTPSEIDAVVKERMAAGEDLYRLDRGAFADLDPDLVITQDLCAVCAVDVSEVEDALEFLACSAAVVTLDPMSLDEVIDSIGMVAAVTGTEPLALELQDELRQRLRRVGEDVKKLPRPKVLVLEWADPAFTAGHWVPDLVESAGGESLLGRPGENSVGVEWGKVRQSGADIVVVSPCGFRLDGAAEPAEHVIAQGHLPPKAQVWAIDADAFMVRPGPRVVEGVEILASIFHSEARGPVDPVKARRIA
ncbi:MAG: iron complex transport system substrate-binding protein [Minisyncoccia bacterium]|jgi:iron complex transport system substrate-binding protein